MLAIETDLSITQDMNQISVEVRDANDHMLSYQDHEILPVAGGQPLPATVAILPPNEGGQVVHVRVTAKKTSVNKQLGVVVRDAWAKVPTDRVAMLRMPLHWLCDEMTKEDTITTDGKTLFTSTCGAKATCVAGICQDANVDVDELPDYAPEAVFGGGSPTGEGSYCLDVRDCFLDIDSVKPDDDCTVPLPRGATHEKLNVALVLGSKTEGHCLDEKDGGTCYMPLNADASEGFVAGDDKIVLPKAACERTSVTGVAVSTRCKTKDLAIPICGPWTGWAQPSGSGGNAGESSAQNGAGTGPEGSAGESSSQGGTSSLGSAGETNAMSTAGDVGAGLTGNGAAGETSGTEPCPVDATLATPYYYVLLDTSSNMQTVFSPVMQALTTFVDDNANKGIFFGLQVTGTACAGDFQTPFLDFSALPTKLANSIQPGTQPTLQLDNAMLDTEETIASVPGAVSRTLVLITAGNSEGCANLTNNMQDALNNALRDGVALRPVYINVGANPNLVSGLSTSGAPQPVTLNGLSQPSQLVAALDQFRDEIAPCTFEAPGSASYRVIAGSTTVPLRSSYSQCGNATGYYKTGNTFTLCPASCGTDAAAAIQTDACVLTSGGTGAGGTSAAGGSANGGAGRGGAGGLGAGSGRGGRGTAGGG